MTAPFIDMMKNFMEIQQQTISAIHQYNKNSLFFTRDYAEIIENNIKFHKAAIEYHKSIVDMMESTQKCLDIVNFKIHKN